MKWNWTRLTAGCRHEQGGMGMKIMTALILALALALAMLCAVAEDSDEGLVLGETVQASDEAITIEDEAAGEDGMDIELADEAILDGDALVVDGLSLDGLKNNLLSDGLAELESIVEDNSNALADNESNPEDFEIDEDGVLVKYKGKGGDVVIPDGVTAIGKYAFDICSKLTSVTIPDSVTSIGKGAFRYCSSLTSVTIPDSVTSIGEGAFDGCDNLTSVTIPDSVTYIATDAFKDCDSLDKITVSVDNPVYSSENGVLYSRDMSTLLCCPGAKTSVTIPDSVTSIGESAFRNCESLTSVTIPDSVTSIGEEAFYGCDNLTSVTIPDSVTSIGEGAFEFCRSLTSVTIPDSVTSIGDWAFYYCTSLTSVTIPNSVTSIGKSAFGWCYSLTTVTIPNSVTSIGNLAFGDCTKLTSVTIPDSVTSIGEGAFERCSSLTSVTIPDSVTNIGTAAFIFCDSLDKITVAANNPAYISENGILYSRDMSTLLCCPGAKTSVTIPNSVTNIENYAFSGCESLTSVTIPDSVTRIGEHAFYYCTSLTSVTIPSSVTSIGFEAFRQCYNLTTVTIPDSVTRIGVDAFYDCDNLTIYGENGSYAEAYAKKNGFKFSALSEPVSLAKARLTVKDQVYNGKALKPAVTVKYGKKTLKKGTDYTVSYKNNKAIGTATVTVTGKGDYTGTAKKTFKINPKAVSGLKLTAGKGRLTTSWKKAPGGISGYQLQYGLKKSFSGAKNVNVSKASTVKGTLKNLKAGKTYYVRIRAFKKVGKTTYWSAWSAAKKAKVK